MILNFRFLNVIIVTHLIVCCLHAGDRPSRAYGHISLGTWWDHELEEEVRQLPQSQQQRALNHVYIVAMLINNCYLDDNDIKRFIQDDPIDEVVYEGIRPLYGSALQGYKQNLFTLALLQQNGPSLEKVLAHGAAVNQALKDGETALDYACAHRDFVSVRALVRYGSIINSNNFCTILNALLKERTLDIPVVWPLLYEISNVMARLPLPRELISKILHLSLRHYAWYPQTREQLNVILTQQIDGLVKAYDTIFMKRSAG